MLIIIKTEITRPDENIEAFSFFSNLISIRLMRLHTTSGEN
jgi:hypothetical protein